MQGQIRTDRCTFCNTNWSANGRFTTCPDCKERTTRIWADPEEVLNDAQSLARAHTIQQEHEQAAELARQEAVLAICAAERVANNAAAALAYDLEREWLTAAPDRLDAWVSGSA